MDTCRQTKEDGQTLGCRYYILVGEDGEEASVPNLTVSAGRIDQLMELLVRNGVTPVTLRDVVEDWL